MKNGDFPISNVKLPEGNEQLMRARFLCWFFGPRPAHGPPEVYIGRTAGEGAMRIGWKCRYHHPQNWSTFAVFSLKPSVCLGLICFYIFQPWWPAWAPSFSFLMISFAPNRPADNPLNLAMSCALGFPCAGSKDHRWDGSEVESSFPVSVWILVWISVRQEICQNSQQQWQPFNLKLPDHCHVGSLTS